MADAARCLSRARIGRTLVLLITQAIRCESARMERKECTGKGGHDLRLRSARHCCVPLHDGALVCRLKAMEEGRAFV